MRKLVTDYSTRSYLLVLAGFGFNSLYALVNLLAGVFLGVRWLVTMGLYYLMLAAMRFAAIEIRRKPAHTETCMRVTGALLISLSMVVAMISEMSISLQNARARDTVVMIAIAAYTFTKLTLTVAKAARRKRYKAPFFRLIRTISYAEIAAQLLTLQRSMLATFGGGGDSFTRTMDIGNSFLVFLVTLFLGISLLVRPC